MADTKISDLPSGAPLISSDIIALARGVSNVSGTTSDMSAFTIANTGLSVNAMPFVNGSGAFVSDLPTFKYTVGTQLLDVTNLTVSGDLIVSGTTTTLDTVLNVTDNIITINDGEIGAGVTAGSAGLLVDRGSLTDFEIRFDETSDFFKVGQIGSLQVVATREDAPIDTGIAAFDTATNRFITDVNVTSAGGAITANGLTVNGTSTFVGLPTIQGASTDSILKLERTTTSAGFGFLGANSTSALVVLDSGAVNRFTVTQAGNVLIKTTVDTGEALQVNGAINGDNAAHAASSAVGTPVVVVVTPGVFVQVAPGDFAVAAGAVDFTDTGVEIRYDKVETRSVLISAVFSFAVSVNNTEVTLGVFKNGVQQAIFDQTVKVTTGGDVSNMGLVSDFSMSTNDTFDLRVTADKASTVTIQTATAVIRSLR